MHTTLYSLKTLCCQRQGLASCKIIEGTLEDLNENQNIHGKNWLEAPELIGSHCKAIPILLLFKLFFSQSPGAHSCICNSSATWAAVLVLIVVVDVVWPLVWLYSGSLSSREQTQPPFEFLACLLVSLPQWTHSRTRCQHHHQHSVGGL